MSNQLQPAQTAQNLPTTPDWSQAPRWANYFAIDKSGEGWWFERMPKLLDGYWRKEEGNWCEQMGFCGEGFAPTGFEKSLQHRPVSTRLEMGNPNRNSHPFFAKSKNVGVTTDWSQAPGWAMWHAVNENGQGFWFENEPELNDDLDNGAWIDKRGRHPIFSGIFTTVYWDTLKIQRPKIEGLKPDGVWIDEMENFANVSEIKPPRTFSETATVYFNTEITGYMAGKNSFITGLVDLLLARMAKEERFSDDENKLGKDNLQPFDVVEYTTSKGNRWLAVGVKNSGKNTELSWVLKFGECCYTIGNLDTATNFGNIRTITELEAVEFRKAMEAVYG